MSFALITYRIQALRIPGVESCSVKFLRKVLPLIENIKTRPATSSFKMTQCNGNVEALSNSLPHRIGFVGGGKMALALGKGFMAAGLVAPEQVYLIVRLS